MNFFFFFFFFCRRVAGRNPRRTLNLGDFYAKILHVMFLLVLIFLFLSFIVWGNTVNYLISFVGFRLSFHLHMDSLLLVLELYLPKLSVLLSHYLNITIWILYLFIYFFTLSVLLSHQWISVLVNSCFVMLLASSLEAFFGEKYDVLYLLLDFFFLSFCIFNFIFFSVFAWFWWVLLLNSRLYVV